MDGYKYRYIYIYRYSVHNVRVHLARQRARVRKSERATKRLEDTERDFIIARASE